MFIESLLLFCLLLLGWLFYAHYIRPYYVMKRAMQLPGPPPSVYYGNYSDIARYGYRKCVSKWALEYGSTFVYYLGAMPVVLTADPEVIKSIMIKNFDCFINRNYVPDLLGKEIEELALLRDERWYKIRRIMAGMFTSKRLKMMSPIIDECCVRIRDNLYTVSNTGQSVDIWKWFGPVSLEVALAAAFSRDISTKDGEEVALSKAVGAILSMLSSNSNYSFKWLQTMLSQFPWSEFILKFIFQRTSAARHVECSEKAALELIEDRRKVMAANGNTPSDFLQFLLEVHDESGKSLSNEEIIGAMNSVIFAAYDTIRANLCYTAYLLALNPSIQDKLAKDIQDYYEANPDSSLYDAAENIEYVTMVLYESMRMFPPTPETHRECNKTCKVAENVVIPKGTGISFGFFLLHHNPEYWPNPERFDPERFNPNSKKSYPAFAYLPFGEGPRHCIGKRMALLEVKMILVAMLRDFRFQKVDNTEAPLDLVVDFSTSPTKGSLYLSIVSTSQ